MKLKNKVALITGASRGIGKAIALSLAKEGVETVLNYNSDVDGVNAVHNEIEKMGQKSMIVQADISDELQVEEMFADIRKNYPNGIDILINNAGIFDESDCPESVTSFKNIIDTNFLG